MQESQFLERIWEKYKEENTYSEGIAFADTLILYRGSAGNWKSIDGIKR